MGRPGDMHDRHTPSQVSVSNAMRARDVSRPRPEDVEAADALVIKHAIRRDDQRSMPKPGPRGRRDHTAGSSPDSS